MLIYALLVMSLLEGEVKIDTIYYGNPRACVSSKVEAILTDNVLFAECQPTWYF